MNKAGESMNIRVTEKAEAAFRTFGTDEEVVIRVNIQPGGGCSATVDIELTLDELNESETVYSQNGLSIQMDTFAKDYIGEKLTIDYGTGFRLYTPNETMAYGMSVHRAK
jgi:Fe-S cluster assembly iron-binding protein IscA